MTGHEYERVVAAYLRHKGYNRVKVTKGSGDFGVDVIAHKGKKKYAVQCKYYKSPVSLDAVQEVIAGKAMYGCDSAMVVTNSTFTKAAEELAKCNGVVLFSGVESSGFGVKDILITAGVIGAAFLVFVLLAAGSVAIDTIKAQFESGNYAQAILNVVECVCFLAVLVGLPICVKQLVKRLKNKQQTKACKTEIPNITKPTEPKGSANISYGAAVKNREEYITALKSLRANDFDTYTQIYDVMKIMFAENRLSTPLIQMRLNTGYVRAARVIGCLENIGFISSADNAGKRFSFVTEQEIVDLLAEVENSI